MDVSIEQIVTQIHTDHGQYVISVNLEIGKDDVKLNDLPKIITQKQIRVAMNNEKTIAKLLAMDNLLRQPAIQSAKEYIKEQPVI